uniref:McrBC 5-methylcytosine restriction system component-like protein n=1 Tax=Nitratidesulfovibrio vulgaris (strain DSM 19637 / Miyazaki F) TaxID=883 RepID=B8DPA2_NITV9
MIKRAIEGTTTWLPDISADDIPEAIPNGISLHIKNGILGIEAQGVVGALRLANGETLHILPKIGDVNFFHLLFKAEGLQNNTLQELNSFASYFTNEDHTPPIIIAKNLLLSVNEILHRSPTAKRFKVKKNGNFVAGSLNIQKTIFGIHSRAHKPIHYTVKEKTLDTPENRILTAAINIAIDLLPTEQRLSYEPIYLAWLQRFPHSTDILADLETTAQNIASNKYGGPRDYYKRSIILAQILFGYRGYGLSGTTSFTGDAILLNTAAVFEKFVRKIISLEYTAKGIVVSKETNSPYSLYTNGSYSVCPDIIISEGGNLRLIADAKYKKPTISDHYQLYTYLSVLGAKRGALIAPSFTGFDIETKEFQTPSQHTITEIYLPMQNIDLAENFLKNILRHT